MRQRRLPARRPRAEIRTRLERSACSFLCQLWTIVSADSLEIGRMTVCVCMDRGYAAKAGLTKMEHRSGPNQPSKANPSLNIPCHEGQGSSAELRSSIVRLSNPGRRRKHCANCNRPTELCFARGSLVWWRCRKCVSLAERLVLYRKCVFAARGRR